MDRRCAEAPFDDQGELVAPISAQQVVRARDGSWELYGPTSAEVERVAVEYEVRGADFEVPADLMRAGSEGRVRRAGIPGPFGYLYAEVPEAATKVHAIARGADGAKVAEASFEDLIAGVRRNEVSPRTFVSGPGSR